MKWSWPLALVVVGITGLTGRAQPVENTAFYSDTTPTSLVGTAPGHVVPDAHEAQGAQPCASFGEFHCDPCQDCNWYAAVGFYYLEPVLFMFDEDLDFNWSFADASFTPRFWLGWDCGQQWGVRAQYWFINTDGRREFFFSDDIERNEETIGSWTVDLGIDVDLEFHVLDTEATKRRRWLGVDWLFAGGLRFAYISQEFDTDLEFNYEGEDLTTEGTLDLRYRDRFHGLGPTAALEGRLPIGCTGWSIYGMGRGTLLIGSRQKTLTAGVEVTGENASGPFEVQADLFAETRDEELIPVGELELGVEWTRCWGNRQWFLQAAAVGQIWGNAIDFSDSSGILLGVAEGQLGNIGAQIMELSKEYSHGFFGLTVTAGVDF